MLCCCSLAGTAACRTCNNRTRPYYPDTPFLTHTFVNKDTVDTFTRGIKMDGTGSKTDNEKDKLDALYDEISRRKKDADRCVKSCHDSIKCMETEKAHFAGISSNAEDLLVIIEKLRDGIYPTSCEKTNEFRGV